MFFYTGDSKWKKTSHGLSNKKWGQFATRLCFFFLPEFQSQPSRVQLGDDKVSGTITITRGTLVTHHNHSAIVGWWDHGDLGTWWTVGPIELAGELLNTLRGESLFFHDDFMWFTGNFDLFYVGLRFFCFDYIFVASGLPKYNVPYFSVKNGYL